MWGLDLEKALDSTTASGTALIPQVIDPYMAELALLIAPLRTLIPRTPWKSGTYDRNKRIAFGKGRFVPDATTSGETQSTIERFQEPLKIIQSKGGVTGFLQASAQELLDALKLEINGHIISNTYEEEFGFLWANSAADQYMFKGLDTWLQTNVFDGAGANVSFEMVDNMIDGILRRGGKPAFITMSHSMQSYFSRLLTNQQRFLDKVEIEGGIRLVTYRDVPIYPSSFLQGSQAWTGSTVVATGAATGGAMSDGDYFYKVAAVLQTGETLPATECTATLSAGTSVQKITLTWTAPGSANSVRLYKIYRSNTTNTEVLYTVIPGVSYSAASDIVGTLTLTDITTWVDTGVRTTQVVAGTTVTGAAFTPSTAQAVAPLAANLENIFVVSTEVPGVEGLATHAAVLKDLSYMPLAKIADKEWFLALMYEALICVEQFSARTTRVKNIT